MKRFAFRLERVLQLREAAEREQARALARALEEEAARREVARLTEQRLAEARTQYATTPRDLSQAGTLQNLELALEVLGVAVGAAARAHEESLVRLESERQAFEKARMARRVIERLREQRRETWGEELSRLEQMASDEVAIELARQAGREAP